MADPSAPLHRLPGLHLPLTFVPTEGHPDYVGPPFPSALNHEEGCMPLTTLREFAMLRFMNQITDTVDWHKRVFNDMIVEKLKSDVLSAEGVNMTQKMVDWCIDELRYKARFFHKTGIVVVYNGNVVKSDSAVPLSVQQALQAAVKPLEDVPSHMKDWHPGSGEKVLDLVHPSLFPLVYGFSRVLPRGVTTLEDCIQRCGEGEVLAVRPVQDIQLGGSIGPPYGPALNDAFSRRFQWLPCEVDISGERAKIMSYINNLHPERHPDLYDIIAQVITHAIPLWNLALVQRDQSYSLRIGYDVCEYDPDPESWPESEKPQQEEGEDEYDFDERREDWFEKNRRVVLPEPGPFTPPRGLIPADLKGKFGSRGLQVIVKLANIELTPEKPAYEGGTWHVEGQLNEHICATALYYYASENITESRIAFRQHSGDHAVDHIRYGRKHWEWLPAVFGCEEDQIAVQDVGRVATRAGRLIAFPNILQHQVQPFRLADATRPGHRKLLALFLVDPHVRVISTAHVPPQQRAWWGNAFAHGGLFAERLPVELRDKIVADVDGFPLTLDGAKWLRVKLMEERRQFTLRRKGKAIGAGIISLCEH